jgi:hypothetical protein
MARKEVKKAPDRTEDGYVYLTKRMVVHKATIDFSDGIKRF